MTTTNITTFQNFDWDKFLGEDTEQELEVQGNVSALQRTAPFYTIDEQGNTVKSGVVGTRRYDGRLNEYFYHSDADGKQYSLGTRQKAVRTIDHTTILNPILDTGDYQIEKIERSGGTGLFALLSNPDVKYQDMISWDHEMFHSPGEGELSFSLAVWADIRFGKAVRVEGGFFRSLCSNGLVSRTLGAGSFRSRASRFDPAELEQFLSEGVEQRFDRMSIPSTDSKVLSWVNSTLEDRRLSPEPTALPSFAQAPFQTLGSLPIWAQEELGYQLNLIQENQSTVSTLDVLNAVTNIPNGQPERQGGRFYFTLESLSNAVIDAANVAAFKMDLSPMAIAE